jgi:hypothetical protein
VLASVDPVTVQIRYDIRPDDLYEFGGYCTRLGNLYYSTDGASLLLVQLSTWRILQAATEDRLTPAVFWATSRALRMDDERKDVLCNGPIPGIDYGAIQPAFTNDVFFTPMKVADSDGGSVDDWWARLLTNREMSPEEIRQEAIMGRGNLWVFRRPDR